MVLSLLMLEMKRHVATKVSGVIQATSIHCYCFSKASYRATSIPKQEKHAPPFFQKTWDISCSGCNDNHQEQKEQHCAEVGGHLKDLTAYMSLP